MLKEQVYVGIMDQKLLEVELVLDGFTLYAVFKHDHCYFADSCQGRPLYYLINHGKRAYVRVCEAHWNISKENNVNAGWDLFL
jgi:hypothetical protein